MNDLLSDQELGLYKKLREVAEAIGYFDKRGHNDFQNYDYVQAADVVRQVREEMLKRDLVVVPGATGARHEPYGSKGGLLTTVDLQYTVIDTETGAMFSFPWVGTGADVGDKGLYKAFTGGLKYALQTLFMVPTTDDPERDSLTENNAEMHAAMDRASKPHKDNLRPAAPLIPADRATDMFRRAKALDYVTYDMNAAPGSPPKFHLALKSALALRGVQKIGELNVDQAESFEAWLTEEETKQAAEQEAQA